MLMFFSCCVGLTLRQPVWLAAPVAANMGHATSLRLQLCRSASTRARVMACQRGPADMGTNGLLSPLSGNAVALPLSVATLLIPQDSRLGHVCVAWPLTFQSAATKLGTTMV